MSLIDPRPTTLLNRFTAAIAARLDATLSTLAVAATALSTTYWTNARAEKLDYLDKASSTIGAQPPTTSGLKGRITANADLVSLSNNAYTPAVTATETAYNTWKTLLTVTGAGVISLLAVKQTAGGNASSRDIQLSLQIDGNEVYLSDADLWQLNSTDDNKGLFLVGTTGYLSTSAPGSLPFKTSFTVRFKKTENATGTIGLTGYAQYHLTA